MKTQKASQKLVGTIALGALLLLLPARAVRGANLVFNGGFEQGGTGWGWTYNLGIASGFPNAAEGGNWADVYGTIYQDLPTVAGQQYHLHFALAGNFNISAPQVVNVLWDGIGVGNASWNPAGHNINNMGWVGSDFDLIASDSSTRLTFDNPYVGDSSGRIARIDAISVTVVPEPSGLLLIGVAAFASLRRRR